MDKLKQTFSRSRDTEADDTATAGATGKVTGQGSHFSSAKTMDRDTLGATAAAQQDGGVGGVATDPTAAQATAGPEVGGNDHVGTIDRTQLSQGSSEPPVGQTTTYSTHHLAKGDPTPSVVDPESSDPTSFRKPESTAPATGSITAAGVPPNAAQVAASKAFGGSTRGEGMPGAFPSDTGYENPYRAENLDPRVDNLPIRSKDNTHSGVAAAAAGAALGAGVASESTDRSTSRTTAEPPVLTSTVDAADKSTAFSEPQQTRAPAPGVVGEDDQEKQSSGFMGKALAAVGLGGAAGAAGYGLARRDGKESAVGDTTLPADSTPQPTHGRKESIPTTAYPAGADSPQAINPPVGGTAQGAEAPPATKESHTGRNAALGAAGLGAAGAAGYGASQYANRRGDDPTRASPATVTTIGQDNTSKLRDDLTSQPSGISSEAKDRAVPAEQESHTGRNVALGAAGLGAAGAAGYGASQYADRRANEPSRIAPATATTLGQDNTSKLRDDLASQPSGISTEAKQDASAAQTTSAAAPSAESARDEDHTRRNTALAAGGVGAGVGAAGAYAATRDNKQEPFGHTAIYGPSTTSTSTQPQVTSSQPTSARTTDQPSSGYDQTRPKDEEDHSGRNAALAGAAGVGAVGAGAYAATEASKKRAEEDAAKQAAAAEKERKAAEKARADQDKAHKKELEKQEKAASKEEKKHQKEAEKTAKKEEKEHQKEVAALEKQRTKDEEERRRQQEEEDDRKKKAAAAAAGGAGAAGAGAYAYSKSKEDESPKSPTKSEEKGKKPGLFKRIFKRRKNKDTGESEEYSSDEEEKDSHKGALAGAAAGTGALGAGVAYGAHEREERKVDSTDPSARDIGTAHTTDEPESRYEAVSGGAQKPSYNPLKKDDPSKQQTFDDRTGHQAEPYRYDDQRATTTTSSTGDYPVERTTGLAYDPSKDPVAARRLSEADANTPAEVGRTSESDSGEPESPSGKRGFRQKLKEAITGHKEEEDNQHGDHSVLHKKTHQIPEEVRTSTEGR